MNSPYQIIDRAGNAVKINLVLELHGGGRIMTPSRCPICGGDAWDNHAACMQEEPPRCTGTAPRTNPHDYDTTPRGQMQEQERRIARAWEKYDRD